MYVGRIFFFFKDSVVLRCTLSQSELTSGTWEERFEEINFADFRFDITHHFLKQEHVRTDQKEEPKEGTFMHAPKFIEKKKNVCSWISCITSNLGSSWFL